ncbi:lipopolysaccharide biosynthesis protein [Penaeicola halotolerans]|uniref:lipopolysaccharide biosynthesis protein n=1 Tax=Penaeicola halotolerans TaxID=2793196 RepID=UPI001CF828D1|nr:oligosaccharide flippase family protein [Penaeicola halotolerans]
MSIGNSIKNLISDSFIYGISGILTRFIGLFLTPIYTRVYSPDDYGVIGILSNSYVLISIILVFALDNSTARWFYDTTVTSERKKIINTWTWFYLGFSLLVSIFIFFSSEFWASLLLEEYSNGTYLVKLLAVTFPLLVWPSVAINVLRFERKAKLAVFLSLFQSISLILLNVLFVVVLKMGVAGVYYAQLLGAVMILPLVFYFLRDWLGWPNLFEYRLFKPMILYAIPFVPASIGYWVVNLSGVFFINEYLEKSDVGLYQIGISVAAVTGLATTAFQQAWSPFAFSILNQANSKDVYAASLLLYVLVIGAICTLISVFSYEALVVLTTPDYYDAAIVASILTFNYLLIGISSIASLGAAIAKKTAPLGLISIISSVVLILLNFLFIPVFGKEGAAISICIAQLIIPIYMFWKSQQLYFIPYNFLKNWIIILLFISVSTLSFILPETSFWMMILWKIILVSFTFSIIAWMNRNEIKRLLQNVKLKEG